jgi:hypothetical protein
MPGTLLWRHGRHFVGTGSAPASYLQSVRTGATLVLVAAVVILAALALADALRPKRDSAPSAAPPASTSTRAEPPTLLGTLRDEAISGFVLYSDRDCRLHSLLLPRMVDDVVRDEGGSDVFHCRFDVDGGRIVDDGRADVAGGLAFRDGEVVSGNRVVLTHDDLMRAARRHPNIAGYDPNIPLRIAVDGLASFGVRKPVVAMTISARHLEPQYLIASFEGHAVRAVAARFRGPYRNLFTSNDGALIGAEDSTVITRTGRTIDPPQGLPASRAIAFSPDDRWIVRVNGISTYLVGAPEGDRPPRVVRLPIPARDLVWEPVTSGTSSGPPIRR